MTDGPGTALLLALLIFGLIALVTVGLVIGRRPRAPREDEAAGRTGVETLERPPEAEGAPVELAPPGAETPPLQTPETLDAPPAAQTLEAPPAPPVEAPPAPTEAPPADTTPVEAPPLEPAPVEPPEEAPKRARVRSIGSSLRRVFKGTTLTEEDWEDLEEVLLRADVGVAATQRIVTSLRKQRGVSDGIDALRAELLAVLGEPDRSLRRKPDGLTVWLVTGVNGVGKTTTIGKLSAQLAREDAAVVLAAADTFRAAADEQLDRWGQAAGAEVIRGAQGSDPAAVVFDGVVAARARGADVLIVDTAGRLQTKRNLMEELGKIKRVLERECGPPDEVLLVLDATTGQNGLQQARAFTEVAEVSGVVLTKLDGSAKGGIVVAVQQDLGIPVKLVGLGEGIDDLAPFEPKTFVDDLIMA